MGEARRILVVDDDQDCRDVMCEVLDDAGYDVVGVDDGADALAFAARDRPRLVLLDLMMENVSGWEVLDALRSDARLRTVPVVVVSAAPRSQMPMAVPFLRKPFCLQDLLEAVSTHTTGPNGA